MDFFQAGDGDVYASYEPFDFSSYGDYNSPPPPASYSYDHDRDYIDNFDKYTNFDPYDFFY